MPPSTPAPPTPLDAWRTKLQALRADAARLANLRAHEKARVAAQAELAELIQGYLAKRVSLAELRASFHQKTQREWAALDAAGPNGAMVLNQIAGQAELFPEVEKAWRRLLPVPADGAAADRLLAAMNAVLDEVRERSDTPQKVPHNARIPAIASVLWSAQTKGAWPEQFGSVVRALVRDRLYDGEGHGAFRTAVLDLRKKLGAWGLEIEELAASDGVERSDGDPAQAQPKPTKRIWLIAPGRNAVHWPQWQADNVMTIGWDEIKDLRKFSSREAVRDRLRELHGSSPDPTNAARACWQFAHDIRPGDIVYAKRGIGTIVGRGEVTSDYRYQTKGGDPQVRSVRWDQIGDWKTDSSLAMKTLTEIGKSPGLVKELSDLLGEQSEDAEPEEVPGVAGPNETYTLDHASAELFMSSEQLEELTDLWEYKKNLILQGPPGVGKTFVATRLAHLLIGSTDEEQICRVQFHPSYAYEDFVQGIRPTTKDGGGFERHDGPFLRFCKQALQDPESKHVLIIDEINRGNVSKILGELLSLLEADKRDPRYGMTLAYARHDEPRFHVPPNLYVVGMMNTADRALSLVDYALRRRFVFVDVAPAFGRAELIAWWTDRMGIEGPLRARIEKRLLELNHTTTKDPSLGSGYAVGHSYFVQQADAYDGAWFERVLRYEIEPLLREYWFDSPQKLTSAMAALRST